VKPLPTTPALEAESSPSRRFGGVERAFGSAALLRFAQAHVCIIGLGGVGSWAVEALSRSGIGNLTLIDLDHVAESNINRQLHALTPTLGQAKTEVMAERVRHINPHCKVHLIDDFISPENVAALLIPPHDYVIDCVDSFRTKAAIVHHCKRRKIKLITVGGAGGMTDPTRIRIADLTRSIHDPLFARTRKLLRLRYGFSSNPKRRFDIPCVFSEEQPVYPDGHGQVRPEKPEDSGLSGLHCAGGIGSVVTVTASFGLVAASHVLRKLANAATSKHESPSIEQCQKACSRTTQ
jgi:tRNA A37 threonylcarbamoyladenosine dehydratase